MIVGRVDKYRIDIKDYIIIKEINKGSFGIVYEVKNNKTDQTYAAKVILNSESNQSKQMIDREIGIMMRVSHPTLMGFRGFSLIDFNGSKNITILMDLFEHGSLADILEKVKKGLLNQNYDNTTRQIILVGVAYGMLQLHQHRVIHRDLKPDNILMDSDFHPHISDFGLSKFYDAGHSKSQSKICGTPIYMAPEVINGSAYDGKADVYSFGIIMYQVITDCTPYPVFESGKMPEWKFHQKVVEENYRPEFTVSIKRSLQNLIERCWTYEPRNRPTFEEIFHKLAYSEEFSIYEMLKNEEEEEEEETESSKEKYYLEDIDLDDLADYIENITNNDRQFPSDLNELKSKIEEQNRIIQEKDKLIKEKEKIIQEKDKKIRELQKQNKMNQGDNDHNINALEKDQSHDQKISKRPKRSNETNHSNKPNENSNEKLKESTNDLNQSNKQTTISKESTKIQSDQSQETSTHNRRKHRRLKETTQDLVNDQNQYKTTTNDPKESTHEPTKIVNQPKMPSQDPKMHMDESNQPKKQTKDLKTMTNKNPRLVKPSTKNPKTEKPNNANLKASTTNARKKKQPNDDFANAHNDVMDLIAEYNNM